MNQGFDELAKALAEDVSRREALRRVGSVLATALLASFGLKTAWGACPTGKTPCSGKCVNLQTDAKNCGSCGTVCARGQDCVNGTCTGGSGGGGGGCPSGQTKCKGTCVNLQTDSQNCGSCGHACGSGQVCCGGTCTPLGTNSNCRGCGDTCRSDQSCLNGVCQCGSSLTECDGICANTQQDPNNCGRCGNACSGSTPRCVNGSCACSANGATCLENAECCSGVCVSGSCICLWKTAPCSSSEQCCSGICSGGICDCKQLGASCTGHVECCGGYCHPDSKVCTCLPNGAVTSNITLCCSGNANGTIYGPVCCGASGAPCQSSGGSTYECCSGTCSGGYCT